MDSIENAAERPRVLLIEDDADIAKLVALHLSEQDVDLEHCERGDLAYQRARTEPWALLILDLRLPGMNGLDICKKLRSEGVVTPILMLTSKSSELDRVLGLELGADDYLTKPFSPLELVARVKAMLRRASLNRPQPSSDEEELQVGPIAISVRDHRVQIRGQDIDLTAREFELLLHFVRQPGRVFRRMELLDEVWGYGHDGYEHTVNSHINRLRAKIEDDPGSPQQIVTVWGVGYKFEPLP